MIDAMENRDMATIDIPSAFMQAFIDELVHIKFDNKIIDMLCQVDLLLEQYVAYKNGKRVLYTKLNKALYGTVQASRLFWERLSSFLIDKNKFERNPYNFCIVNKTINRKQFTIVWYVDNLKLSHEDPDVISNMIKTLEAEFGKVSNLTI
jgi:Reverse transcriptase (RNA-dependent DNA polymerase)